MCVVCLSVCCVCLSVRPRVSVFVCALECLFARVCLCVYLGVCVCVCV